MAAFGHVPCMPAEVAEYLACRPGGVVVDGTLGGAGHARAICRRIHPGGLLIGIDQDPDAIRHAADALAPWGPAVRLVHDNFRHLPSILAQQGITHVDGILVDLGLSTHQLEGSGRGFSFQKDEPLDMRMDPRSPATAADLVNGLPEAELARLFWEYGEERRSRAIARRIAAQRRQAPIRRTGELAGLVAAGAGPKARHGRIHPATRVFMALRIAVNRELEALEAFLPAAVEALAPAGRLCVLAFHSLEDRIVKQAFRRLGGACQCPPGLPRCVCAQVAQVRVLTPRVVKPTAQEVESNPLCRSCRLRAVERLAP
jgi:16S rRNA (cytosine1402-N4)-methyltransferase